MSTPTKNSKDEPPKRSQEEVSSSPSSSRVLQQLVDGIARGVPASYETLTKLAIEGVPYVSSEVSVQERKRKLLEMEENDAESALRRLEKETTRGWGFVMGKTLAQIVGGIYIPFFGVHVVNGVAKLQSIWGQIRTVAIIAALYGHDVDDKTIRHRILFCVLWSDKKLSLEDDDDEDRSKEKTNTELIRRSKFYFGPSAQIQAGRTIRRLAVLIGIVMFSKIFPTSVTMLRKMYPNSNSSLEIFVTIPIVLVVCLILMSLPFLFRVLFGSEQQFWTNTRCQVVLLIFTIVPGILDVALSQDTTFSAFLFVRHMFFENTGENEENELFRSFVAEYALLKATYGVMKLLSRRFKKIRTHKDSFAIVLLAWTAMGFVKIWMYKSSVKTNTIYVKTFVDLAGVVSMWYVSDELRDSKVTLRVVMSSQQLVDSFVSLIRVGIHQLGSCLVTPTQQLESIDRVIPSSTQCCAVATFKKVAIILGIIHGIFRHIRDGTLSYKIMFWFFELFAIGIVLGYVLTQLLTITHPLNSLIL
jgi:hypothetical protein